MISPTTLFTNPLVTPRVLTLTLAALAFAAIPLPGTAASFQAGNGFVVIEAEDFDANFTTPSGAWVFSNSALATDPYSGWGYLAGTGVGGANAGLSPHADYRVNFPGPGTYYIWVSASDAGGKTLDIGLDGAVTPSSADIGGSDGVFGPRRAGEIWWDGYNNTGSGYFDRPYVTITNAGEHVISLFIRDAGLYVDRILLTTDSGFDPQPANGGANGGWNVPPETLAAAPGLGAEITQPAAGRSFASNTVVTVAAKPFTNGTPASRIDFYATPSSGSGLQIGQAFGPPWQVAWTNPAVGNYTLKAVVTDSAAASATSAVVSVSITVPQAYPTPLVWVTNNFDTGLGRFTLTSTNHVLLPAYADYPIDFDWSNTSHAGGPPGELGGALARLPGVAPYVAEPLTQAVSLNDELWFVSSVFFANGSGWNTDFFFGYFDTNSPGSRVGFKILNPNPGWRFRLFALTQSANLPVQIPDATAGQFEFHWIPSGLGDGSGTAIGTVNGVSYTNTWPATGATFNAFGWLLPYQPDFGAQTASAWFDSVQYKVPGLSPLAATRAGSQLVLSWAADGYNLQYKDGSPSAAGSWLPSPAGVVKVGRTYYSTNTIGTSARFYRLQLNGF